MRTWLVVSGLCWLVVAGIVVIAMGCISGDEEISIGRDGDDSCEPADALGVGDCDRMWGIYWNGQQCVYVFGCTCEGADCCEGSGCTGGYSSFQACQDDCGPQGDPTGEGCLPQDVAAVGNCNQYSFLGYFWNGEACEGLCGEACSGTDCDELFTSPSQCEYAHSHCTQSPNQ